jgi:precorrin-3B methylase
MSREGSLMIVGTGIQWAGQTTLAARTAIEQADRVLFAVTDPWAARWVASLNPAAESLPYPRDERSRRQIYDEMVERILAEVRKGQRVCAVFYGHPGVLATAAHEAIQRARADGYTARMLPGVSSVDCLFADLGVDPGDDGCQMYTATDLLVRARPIDPHTPLVLLQIGMIGNRGVFDEAQQARIREGLTALSEVLCRVYPAQHRGIVYEAAAQPTERPRVESVALGELPLSQVSEISTLFVPPLGPAPVDARMLERLGMAPARFPST